MRYHGTLDNGTVFDSSRGRKPLKFHLGMAEVIKGMDITVATMTIGERCVVHIPPGYAYGNVQTGPIPANSELTFELELLEAVDDTLTKLKWQLLGLAIFIFVILVVAPYAHPQHRF